jgi:hypothetical protein
MLHDLVASAVGPISNFYLSASDLFRKMEPVTSALWIDGVIIQVDPQSIYAPNIEKVVVQRDGQTVEPLSVELAPSTKTTIMGLKSTLNAGRLIYPTSAFERGAAVRVTLIPTSGRNIFTLFTQAELLRLR